MVTVALICTTAVNTVFPFLPTFKSILPKNNFDHKPQHTLKNWKHPLPLSEGPNIAKRHERSLKTRAWITVIYGRRCFYLLLTSKGAACRLPHAWEQRKPQITAVVITRGTEMKRTREGKKQSTDHVHAYTEVQSDLRSFPSRVWPLKFRG